ncbi:Uncharacterized protein TPAR_03984 [Tolypocladium paradoxum]|uniref:Uncharacterized protein n=1 Tax=Tolypocladium paradoxum TaxID=94208 RepID=A0A2S4L049_9HYPO|nr:Uncharacterized protein TPAR_03984 [Tolypocladium paradoxum]
MEGSWRMGIGYHGLKDPRAYEIASNRTYLVATVWGYDRGIDPKLVKTPEVSLVCLSPWTGYVPPPPPLVNTTTSSGTSSLPPTTTSSSKSSVAKRFAATALPIPGM